MTTHVETLAHAVAAEVVRRERAQRAPLGRNSLYNATREAAIEVLDKYLGELDRPPCRCKPYHVVGCPGFGEDNEPKA